MSKLIYIPVYFRGQLNDILEGINQLGDPINVPSDTLMRGDLIESHHSFRGKIYVNEEFGNILQAIPLSTIVFILLEIVIFILSFIKRPKEGKKSPRNKVVSFESLKENEPPKVKWYDPIKLLQSFINLRLSFIESAIIDIFFSMTLNISNFSKNSHKFATLTLINFIFSAIMVIRSIHIYTCIYFKVFRLGTLKFTDIEREIVFDGLNENLPKPLLKKHAIVNFLFKVQLIFIPLVLAIGQY